MLLRVLLLDGLAGCSLIADEAGLHELAKQGDVEQLRALLDSGAAC